VITLSSTPLSCHRILQPPRNAVRVTQQQHRAARRARDLLGAERQNQRLAEPATPRTMRVSLAHAARQQLLLHVHHFQHAVTGGRGFSGGSSNGSAIWGDANLREQRARTRSICRQRQGRPNARRHHAPDPARETPQHPPSQPSHRERCTLRREDFSQIGLLELPCA